MPAFILFGRISAISISVALATALHAQPAAAAAQPTDSSFAAAAPANAPYDASVQAPPPEATDEQRGDFLMVRQRYQAALEAYAKVEHPSATLWNKMGIA